ncbi:MAG: hypothetical protein GWN58_40390 [Anaerolineae bacterium]|nr:hypothetical protein [Anaerolineae bacterium]
MGRRYEPRLARELPVRVRGKDRYGNPFVQEVQTLDVSRRGARLDGVACLERPGQIIEVQRAREKARFRVAWVGQLGTSQADQIGIFCLEPGKCIWGIHLPAPRGDPYQGTVPEVMKPDGTLGKPPSRRRSARVDLQLPVTVRWFSPDGAVQEKEALTLTINEHGCLLPLKAAVIEGMNLELVNKFNREVRKGKVVWSAAINPQGQHQVGIELENSGPQFWGPRYAEAVRSPDLSDTWVG